MVNPSVDGQDETVDQSSHFLVVVAVDWLAQTQTTLQILIVMFLNVRMELVEGSLHSVATLDGSIITDDHGQVVVVSCAEKDVSYLIIISILRTNRYQWLRHGTTGWRRRRHQPNGGTSCGRKWQ